MRHSSKQEPRLWRKSLLVGLAILALLITGVWVLGMMRIKPVSRPVIAPPEMEQVPDLEMARTALNFYFEATNDSERFQYLHDGARVGALWNDYYRHRGKPVPMLNRIGPGKLATDGERTLAFFSVSLSPGGTKPMALIWDGRNFGVDWESSVAYGSMDWAEFIESKPSNPQLLRVYLSRASDAVLSKAERESGWRCVAVEHTEELEPVTVKIAPGAAFAIDFTGRQRVPATAEFAFGSPGLELRRVIHEGWSR